MGCYTQFDMWFAYFFDGKFIRKDEVEIIFPKPPEGFY